MKNAEVRDRTAESRNALAKLAHTIPEAVLASGLSRSMLYLAIGRGALRARKCGARTLILDADLRFFLQSLPNLANTEGPSGAADSRPSTACAARTER
jgi:hypothetical protein